MLKDGITPELETRYDEYFKLEERINKMEKIQLIRASKTLSYLLRHNPEDLVMDSNGWVTVEEVLRKLDITFDELKEIVETNDKKRFGFNSDFTKIRANQGHTINVDVELKETTPPKKLYHGTSPTYVKEILKSGGLSKMKRQHVHLSADECTAYNVGKRHSKYLQPAIFVVDSEKMYKDGFKFYLSENRVWLTDYVPKKYITLFNPKSNV
jgi:putative RNA 2'-phosphotransferase